MAAPPSFNFVPAPEEQVRFGVGLGCGIIGGFQLRGADATGILGSYADK